MKRQGLSKLFTTGVMALSLLGASTPVLAQDIFLKIDGIKGESADAKHKDEIEVMSWSWGQSTGTARTRKGVQPASCIQDMHLTKSTDASTPGLIMNGTLGTVLPSAVLVMRKAGEDQIEFLKLTMKNVVVVSYQTGASEGGGVPTESVTLHFETMEGEYRRQNEKGQLGPAISWDITGGNASCQQ